jgi:hypothetical protein
MSTPKKLYAVIPLAQPDAQPDARPKSPKLSSPKQAEKPVSILDQNFNYTSAAGTDLRARFKALGFKTPKPKRVK